ncbi:MAG: N-6 DNA methylase [Phycisphaerae bacterium]
MAKAKITYNERSWRIDVISEINAYLSNRQRAIRRAGGEHTLVGGGSLLFPDVLLFGDQQQGLILQGWELKMPDTPLSDPRLISNFSEKALRLGLRSFLVWNVRQAVLYIRNEDESFTAERQWGPIPIAGRADVANGKPQWLKLLHQILNDLNDFFEQRPETGVALPEVLQDALFAEFLQIYTPSYAATLTSVRRKNATLRAEIDNWWRENALDHPDTEAEQVLAKVNILNWLNKFIFAHCMKRFRGEACQVDGVTGTTTVAQARDVFREITSKCDFMAVFQTMLGEQFVDPKTWLALTEFNALLSGVRLEAVAPRLLTETLAGAVERSRRKTSGQFGTPLPLAELLVRVTVDDIEGGVMDPCCGTGTIARVVYDWKKREGITPRDAIGQIWAGDKFTFPLQLATMALADPEAIGTPLNIFCRDALTLAAGDKIQLTNPNTGEHFEVAIPAADAIVSNLPFVRFETFRAKRETRRESHGLTPMISEVSVLDSKSDLFARIVVRFPLLLHAGSRVGVIIANSWLGTHWGREFREQMTKDFRVLAVIASANQRWFTAAAVVANILVLERRNGDATAIAGEQTNFITIREPLGQWAQSGGGIDELAGQIVLADRNKARQRVNINSMTQARMAEMEGLGLQWTAFFANIDFMDALGPSLLPAKEIFIINRGERRGWDKLFFPPPEVPIEPVFMLPVLKNSRQLHNLMAVPDAKAFCCSLSLGQLRARHYRLALAWINRFAHQTNGSAKPLPDVLRRANCHWYEMKPNTMADFAIPINPDSRLCVFRLRQRAFVNQRLIRFTLREPDCIDIALTHALLNSSLGMFLIEAAGFGRGLGVLDLNASKMAESFHVLNPDAIGTEQAARIKACFQPLLERPPAELPTELASADRLAFDACVADAYGFSGAEQAIRTALKSLYCIRKSAKL